MGRRTGLGQCVDGTFRPAAQVPALKWAPRAMCLAELVPAMVLAPRPLPAPRPPCPCCVGFAGYRGLPLPRALEKGSRPPH